MGLKAGWSKFVDLLMPPPESEDVVFEKENDVEEPVQKKGFATVVKGMFGGSARTGREETVNVVNGGSYTYTDPYDDDEDVDAPAPQQPVRPKLIVHEAPKLNVQIYTPKSFDEVVGIADDLRDKNAVVVNYERVDTDLQRRICDFINGCCYVTDGGVKRVCGTIVLYVPEGVNVAEAMSVAAYK